MHYLTSPSVCRGDENREIPDTRELKKTWHKNMRRMVIDAIEWASSRGQSFCIINSDMGILNEGLKKQLEEKGYCHDTAVDGESNKVVHTIISWPMK